LYDTFQSLKCGIFSHVTHVLQDFQKEYFSDSKLTHITHVLKDFQIKLRVSLYGTVDAKLICKHKRLIPDSNIKACQPI